MHVPRTRSTPVSIEGRGAGVAMQLTGLGAQKIRSFYCFIDDNASHIVPVLYELRGVTRRAGDAGEAERSALVSLPTGRPQFAPGVRKTSEAGALSLPDRVVSAGRRHIQNNRQIGAAHRKTPPE
jgi:hypothetical protein